MLNVICLWKVDPIFVRERAGRNDQYPIEFREVGVDDEYALLRAGLAGRLDKAASNSIF
jgi:hypothetical protein